MHFVRIVQPEVFSITIRTTHRSSHALDHSEDCWGRQTLHGSYADAARLAGIAADSPDRNRQLARRYFVPDCVTNTTASVSRVDDTLAGNAVPRVARSDRPTGRRVIVVVTTVKVHPTRSSELKPTATFALCGAKPSDWVPTCVCCVVSVGGSWRVFSIRGLWAAAPAKVVGTVVARPSTIDTYRSKCSCTYIHRCPSQGRAVVL